MFLMSFSFVNTLMKLLREPWTEKVSIYGIALEHFDGLKALHNWLLIINNQNNILTHSKVLRPCSIISMLSTTKHCKDDFS